jgi:hypothetical protein
MKNNHLNCLKTSLVFMLGLLVGAIIINFDTNFNLHQVVLMGIATIVFYITQKVPILSWSNKKQS